MAGDRGLHSLPLGSTMFASISAPAFDFLHCIISSVDAGAASVRQHMINTGPILPSHPWLWIKLTWKSAKKAVVACVCEAVFITHADGCSPAVCGNALGIGEGYSITIFCARAEINPTGSSILGDIEGCGIHCSLSWHLRQLALTSCYLIWERNGLDRN